MDFEQLFFAEVFLQVFKGGFNEAFRTVSKSLTELFYRAFHQVEFGFH